MPTDPRRVKDLFAAAADLPAADRAAFLARECGPDADLRRRVEQLLAAHDAPASVLDRPLAVPVPPTADGTADYDDRTGDYHAETADAPAAGAGDRVGPYKLLERIGEGGMGEVWVADQTEPIKRRVAVKLIKAGMDSRSVLGRFEAERQALAVMDHPNIAKVLDAGTAADGRPYFVMELVKGTPITEFADARKLTPKQRLELFVPVCQAIQHAHMKGIIHRDIKPGNVLVALHDEVPVPKVIDFGVAKAVGQQLTERTIYTGFGALVGTPAYMAPEQATFNQLDVDTRADVYALGVLLYELLAGSPPIERERLKKAALDEVLRIVREEEPPRPSQRLSTADTRASIAATRGTEPAKLSALMRGELDWIVMKALEKDRTRRYETANGFAADVLRYLSGEPVQAVPPSVGYRVRKFVRRHRGPVVAGSLVFAALVAGIVGTTFGLVRADEKRQEAEQARSAESEQRGIAEASEREAKASEGKAVAARRQARNALDNADKMLRIQERFRPRGGGDRYSEDQLATLNGLAAQFEEVARTGGKPEAAEAYSRLASVQLLLNKPVDQGKSLEKAIAVWAELVRSDPANAAEYTVQVATARVRLAEHFGSNYRQPANATTYVGFGQDPKYLALLRQVAADWKAATDADPANASAFSDRSLALQNVATYLPGQNVYPGPPPPEVLAERKALDREAAECLERAVALTPDDRVMWSRLENGYMYGRGTAVERTWAGLRAALRFPDEPLTQLRYLDLTMRGVMPRDEYTWDSLLLCKLETTSVGPDPADKTAPFEVVFRREVLDPCRALFKESPGYRYASGVELVLTLREAASVGKAWYAPTKPNDPPPPLTADQQRRRGELYAKAVALARDPDTRLPPAFLKFIPEQDKMDFSEVPRPPKKLPPVSQEEYVWFHRLGSRWERNDEAVAELTAELDRRKDWRPTPMFLYRLIQAILPDDLVNDDATPKEKLIDGWTKADALFARFREGTPPDGEAYHTAADNFSGMAVRCADRFRRAGERGYAKKALDRCLELIEATPTRPGVTDWPYRCRCYFDRGNLLLDQGDWANALADYRKCLALSPQKPGDYDPLSIPGMNAVAHFRSGAALLRLNKPDEADRAFDEALKFRRTELGQSRPLPSGKLSVPWAAAVTERDRAEEYLQTGRWKAAVEWTGRALKTLDENAEAYPLAQVNHLRYSLAGIRAGAFSRQNDPEAAVAAWEVGRQFATADELRWFAVHSAGAYANSGRHAEAAARLDDLLKTGKLNIGEYYNLACGYALCSAGTKVDKEQADRYQRLAVEVLQKAAKGGYNDHPHMEKDADLDPLRGRDDFESLLADLKKKFPPKPEPKK